MKLKLLPVIAMLIVITSVMVITAGCKKNNPQNDIIDKPPVFTQLADTAVFVSTLDSINQSSLGTTIYMLNASTGSVSTKYHYAYDPKAKWSALSAGNGFLYNIGSNKINAINMNTGSVLWTDTVNNITAPILHDDTFYGVYSINAGTYGIYALDATKAGKTYLWKSQIPGELRPNYFSGLNPTIKYNNGILYILMDRNYLTALDAKTGAIKWAISQTSISPSYSLLSINNGVIIMFNSIIDAATGVQNASVKPPVIPAAPAVGSQLAYTEFATKDLYFVKTTHFYSPPGFSKGFLSTVDKTTGAEKWRINYGQGQVDYDTLNYVAQFWNNKLVIKKVINTGAGKYGVNTADSHWLADINTGLATVKFDDTDKGNTVANYIIGNTMYFYKRYESTLHGLPFGTGSPPVNYFFAIDLSTGKQKWNNDKLFAGYTGAVSSCVYTQGKGYSDNIQ